MSHIGARGWARPLGPRHMRQWQAAAEMLDLAQALFDSTLDYLKQHVRFNQMLATFLALQYRAELSPAASCARKAS